MDNIEKIKLLKSFIDESDNIVFFGGAGVSTESGIPDFRGNGGLYSQKTDGYSNEEILSNGFFYKHTDMFYDFYKHKMIYKDAKPNYAHKYLAKLEKEGKLKAVITQNIDGLHQLGGSQNVLELHGTTLSNHCTKCGKYYDLSYVLNSSGVPKCDVCKGLIKPDVVLYGEGLDDDVFSRAGKYISKCDMLIVGGTSLTVYPAAYLVQYFQGKHFVILNKSKTPYDNYADLIIDENISEVFKMVENT